MIGLKLVRKQVFLQIQIMNIDIIIYVVLVYQILVGLGMIHPREAFQWIPEEVLVADIVQELLLMGAITGHGVIGATGAASVIPIFQPHQALPVHSQSPDQP